MYLSTLKGEGQHLEQTDLKRPIFRRFEISNIKRTKDEISDFFI